MPNATYPMRTPAEKRDAYLARLTRLKADRSSWITHWSDLNRHILPRSARFFSSDRNLGGKERYNSIYDNSATLALRTFVSGLMTNLTSQARQWFLLTTKDPNLRNSHNVQLWLDEVVERMNAVFSKSNFYRALANAYAELGVFGTHAVLILGDFQTLIHCYPLTVGEYCLEQDFQGRIVTCYREFERTVGEVVKEFGYERCSKWVQQAFDARNHEAPVKLLHVVEPRADQERRPNSPLAIDMPWKSCYLEIGGEGDQLLRESGFKRMRVLAPRWQVQGGDVYGISPAMDALGDIRQLQQMQLRMSQAIDYKTRPPLQVPHDAMQRDSDILPGGIRYYDPGTTIPYNQSTPHGGVRSAFEVNLDLSHLEKLEDKTKFRIQRALYEDMFLLLANDPTGDKTAFEVASLKEEKFQIIGPAIERTQNELLEPAIDIAFEEMFAVGALPPPPPELVGAQLDVEFVGVLAQAQRAAGIHGVQQWTNDHLVVAQARPDVLDNVNFDEWSRATGHMRGVPTDFMVDAQSVQRLREARAEAEAAREQAEMMMATAKTTKDLATAPVGQDSALDEILRQAGAA